MPTRSTPDSMDAPEAVEAFAPALGDAQETDLRAADDPANRRGKYALLQVPSFDGGPDGMNTYLRLGAVPDPSIAGNPGAPPSTGEDLASMVTSFLDDDRIRNPGSMSVADRHAESARLHTKGGWRDHSDGNRITTTRGDKVEVIRGNYALLVLGRQDEAPGGTGWDVSGGHIEGVGGKTHIEWVQTFGGTWRVRETSEKGDTITTQHGNSVTRTYGEIIDSSTGSEDEVFPGEDGSLPAPNPVITDRTWAQRISSYTGSAAKKVPLVESETWATAMTSLTNADSMTDTTVVSGAMNSTTTAGTMTSATTAGTMTSTTTVGTTTSTTTAGAITDITVAGATTTVAVTNTTGLMIGNTMQLNLGTTENLTIGAVLDFTLALMTQITIAGQLNVSLGHTLELDLAGHTQLAPEKTEVGAEKTSVSSTDTVVTGAHSVVAGVINLG